MCNACLRHQSSDNNQKKSLTKNSHYHKSNEQDEKSDYEGEQEWVPSETHTATPQNRTRPKPSLPADKEVQLFTSASVDGSFNDVLVIVPSTPLGLSVYRKSWMSGPMLIHKKILPSLSYLTHSIVVC